MKWASKHLAACCDVLSDGLSWFRSVVTAGCRHEAVLTGSRHPNDLPDVRRINILLVNLTTSLSGTFHAFNLGKYAKNCQGGFCCRFNRHFEMAAMTERIANALCCCTPCSEPPLRVAEVDG